MGWVSNGDSSYWVEDTPEPGQWVGGGGDSPAQFVPDIAPQYAGGGGDAIGYQIPLSPDFIQQQQQQNEQNVSQSTGGLDTGAQGSAYVAPVSQLSANPDPTQPFNFVASPYVTAQNPFSKPINNAYQAYLGRPASQAEMYQYTMLLAQNPDAYNTLVEGIRTSPEAANAAKSGIQNLIIDPRQGDMTGSWLNASYGKYTPTQESGLSKITNAIGGAIPLAALGLMTGGAGAALGLGSLAGGALAGGVTGAAGAGLNGGNVGAGALTGALTGALGAGALGSLGGAGNVASGGLDLGSNFNWNIPTYEDQLYSQLTNAFANPNELGPGTLSASTNGGSSLPYTSGLQQGSSFQYNPATGQFDIPYNTSNLELNVNASGTGTTGSGTSFSDGTTDYVPQPDGTYLAHNGTTGNVSTVNSLPSNAFPLNQAGPSYADLGYTPQAGPSNFELGYNPSTNTNPFSGFNPASSLSSLLNFLTGGTKAGTGVGTGVGAGTGAGTGTGTGTGGGGTGVGGGGTGVGTGTGGTGTGTGGKGTGTTAKLPIPKIPLTPTLSTALRNPTFYQSAPGGLYKGNINPFTFGKDVPIQGQRQNYDPFAALNVAQTPPQSNSNLMANLLRENIYG